MKTFVLALALMFATPALADGPAPEPDHFTYKVEGATLQPGKNERGEAVWTGVVVVDVAVDTGYHWNDDYPAKLTLRGLPEPVTTPKAELKQLDEDFKSSTPNHVRVAIPVTASARADGSATVDAKFSICNERVCLMKKASATAAIVAR